MGFAGHEKESENGADGYGLSLFDDDAAQGAVGGGFDFGADFRGFDLDEGFAFDHGVADGFEPFHDLSLVHSHAPLRKDYVARHFEGSRLSLDCVWNQAIILTVWVPLGWEGLDRGAGYCARKALLRRA